MYYLGGTWRRLEPLERIYNRFPSLESPIYREKTVYSMNHTGETQHAFHVR